LKFSVLKEHICQRNVIYNEQIRATIWWTTIQTLWGTISSVWGIFHIDVLQIGPVPIFRCCLSTVSTLCMPRANRISYRYLRWKCESWRDWLNIHHIVQHFCQQMASSVIYWW
jgi:hypothetical protein